MRTVTIANSFSYTVGVPKGFIETLREKAARDVTDRFQEAAKAAVSYYYGRNLEDFTDDNTPFVMIKQPDGKTWQVNDKQTGDFIFGTVPVVVDINDIEHRSIEDEVPRIHRTIYIRQDYTTCVPA